MLYIFASEIYIYCTDLQDRQILSNLNFLHPLLYFKIGPLSDQVFARKFDISVANDNAEGNEMKYILLYHTFFKFIYFIFNDSRALVLHFSKAWEVFVLNGNKSIRFSFNGVRGQIKLCCLLCLLSYTNSQYTYTSKRTLKSLKLICLKAYLIRFLVVVVIVMPGRCSGV